MDNVKINSQNSKQSRIYVGAFKWQCDTLNMFFLECIATSYSFHANNLCSALKWPSDIINWFCVLSDWTNHCTTSYHEDGLWTCFTQIMCCSPWVSYFAVLTCFHTMWASLGLTVQLCQVLVCFIICSLRLITLKLFSRWFAPIKTSCLLFLTN